MRFLPVTTVLTVSLIGCTATLVSAQETFPSRVIRIVTPATGGGSDVLARMITPALTESLGQQVIVDNRGSLATELVAKAAPDGYTLLIDGSPLWLQPLFRKVGWSPLTDFAALTMAVSSPSMLVVHPSVPVKTLRELIALAKARPGEINYAAGSIGATPHLAGEQFKVMAGVNVVRVPYKGTGPGMIGLMDAVNRFEESQGTQFEVYAASRIRGSMLDELRAGDWLPRSARKNQRDNAEKLPHLRLVRRVGIHSNTSPEV